MAEVIGVVAIFLAVIGLFTLVALVSAGVESIAQTKAPILSRSSFEGPQKKSPECPVGAGPAALPPRGSERTMSGRATLRAASSGIN